MTFENSSARLLPINKYISIAFTPIGTSEILHTHTSYKLIPRDVPTGEMRDAHTTIQVAVSTVL